MVGGRLPPSPGAWAKRLALTNDVSAGRNWLTASPTVS